MTDNKEESGSKHWYTSAKVAWKGRSRSRSKGKISGASPPVTNTVFSSGTSPPSGSSKDDPNSLAPTGLTSTDAHSTHAEIQSEALPGMPEQLLVPRQQHTTAPGNIGPNTQGCRLSQSSIHGVVRDEQTLHGDPPLVAPSAASQELDLGAVGALAAQAMIKDETGLTEELPPPGKNELNSQGLDQDILVAEHASEFHCLAQVQFIISPPTDAAEPQSSPPDLAGEYPPTANAAAPVNVSSAPEPNKDIVASIHVTIEEIKSVREGLKKKKWHYTDRHGKQVDVGERMRKILRSVEDCAKIIDVAIQHHPEITALVWAGARFILMVALNKVEFIDNIEAAMVTIVEKMATCEFYAHIYDEGTRVQLATSTTTKAFDDGHDAAVKELYAAVRAYLDKVKEYFDPEHSVATKIVNHLMPFSVIMQPLIQNILEKEKIVERYAEMATMERIKEDSSRIQQVRDVVTHIRAEMKPLAMLNDILTATQGLNETFEVGSREILNAAQDINKAFTIGSAEILNATRDVKQTVVELRAQVVQSLQPQQREILSSRSLDSELQGLKSKYLAESQQTDIFHANLYVPAQGMAAQHASEEEYFGLWERLEKFMAPESPQRVCLILGAAGGGKSTFNHYIATRLWETYDRDASSNYNPALIPIPVFITLANIHDPLRHNQDLVAELFRRREWPEERISKARRQLQFIFILDGYDEIEKRDRNFYIDNRLGEWNARIVITSRPEYLGSGYQNKFYPPGQPQLLQEYWLAPFSTKDITEYISKYVQARTTNEQPEAPSRSVEDYEQLVERPELRALISNPFLLKMVMTIQPRAGDLEFRRVTLYRKFLDHWLRSAQNRLSRIQLPSALAGPFNTLCEEGFVEHAETYCLDFAIELYRHKAFEAFYFPAARRSARKQHDIWADFLTNEDPKQRLLRYSSPLVRVGNSYRFLHKSLRDFAIAYSMWQDEQLLNEFPIVNDFGIIDFIIEEAEQNEELQARLLACVEESKENPKVAIAAANAITILVRARIRFHEYDLRGICIPGADISAGWFGGAQLQGADLRRVCLDRIWLREADLTGACIDGGEFGEKPYFKLEGTDNRPLTCFYTPDGELLVASGCGRDVQVWSATNCKLLHSFRGHTSTITCAAFPQNSGYDLLASGSGDHTVRLWSRQNQEMPLVYTFDGHTDWVRSIVFSENAKFLASGGDDSIVCLWSVATHSLIHTFHCHGWIFNVAFSPDGRSLLSAGHNVEVWSTDSGKLLQTPQGHTRVTSVAFSPDGQILASGTDDTLLNLWLVSDSDTQLIHTFAGHTRPVHTVAFAPDGRMIATAADDSTFRIWSVASQKIVHVFEGTSPETQGLTSLTFSRDSQRIAIGATDGIIRQWLVPQEGSNSVRVSNGHVRVVNDLALSGDKKLLASASNDGTIRLWSMDPPHMPNLVHALPLSSTRLAVTFSPDSACLITGTKHNEVCVHQPFRNTTSTPEDSVLGTHTDEVRTVAMTSIGNILASGGNDHHICLWSIHSCTKIDTLKGHTFWVRSVDFSPDGQLLASGSSDTTVRLWSVPRREMLHIYEGHTGNVTHVAFSPDGETIASACNKNVVRLWSVPDRKSLHIFEGHTHWVTRVAFSPDGFLLASGSLDKTIRFWSLSSRELVLNVDIQAEISALAWTATSAPGGLIAFGTNNGGVQLLQVIHKPGYSRENPAVELSWFWATDYGAYLNVFGARIEGVTGLSPTNIELLKQRGAIGEPAAGRVHAVEEEE